MAKAMATLRPMHPDLMKELDAYPADLVKLFDNLRDFILKMYPDSNELIYKTHALSLVFSPTLKLSDAFCHIPVYSQHLNLGFNKGAILDDPNGLLTGTGKWIRHIKVSQEKDYDNEQVQGLIHQAIQLSFEDLKEKDLKKGQVVSKIKN